MKGYNKTVKPKIKPAIKRNGNNNQLKKTTTPAENIKISTKSPKIIKKILKIAPKALEIKFEKKTSKYFPI